MSGDLSVAEVLEALAERVEGLLYSDRDVDAEIAAFIGRPLGNVDHWLHGKDIRYRPTAHGYYVADLPDGQVSEAFKSEEFTGSLDAATSLFPRNTMHRSGHSALAPDPAMFFCDAVLESGEDVHALAKREPFARTAAALRCAATIANRAERILGNKETDDGRPCGNQEVGAQQDSGASTGGTRTNQGAGRSGLGSGEVPVVSTEVSQDAGVQARMRARATLAKGQPDA